MKFRDKKFWRLVIFYFLGILVVISGVTILIKELNRYAVSFVTPTNLPAQITKTDQAVAAKIFFTNEPDQSGSLLTATSTLQIISQEIDRAQKTLEIAMYSFNAPVLKEAVYRAAKRGVKVTLILDFRRSYIHNQFFSDLPSNIKRLDLGSAGLGRTSLMHHKFALIDRGEANEKLIFGSFNWTELQAVYDRSFIFISSNHELITSFGHEFDRLAQKEGEKRKLNDENYHPWDLSLQAGAYNYEVWFGPGWPGAGFNPRIVNLLKSARSDIKIMIWDFTDPTLAQVILDRARAGLKITILADSFNFSSPTSVFPLLNKTKAAEHLNNLEILNDGALIPTQLTGTTSEEVDPYLHHHLLIIDNKQVLFGTNNWSKAGSYYNDESGMVSDDPQILRSFLKSFSYNYQLDKAAASR